MKKRLFIILIVLQLLQSNLCALSEPVEIFPGTLVLTDSQTYDSANSLCWIDESLYILGSRAVYHWTKGSETIVLYYLHGFNVREVAMILRRPENTVKGLLCRARRMIRNAGDLGLEVS